MVPVSRPVATVKLPDGRKMDIHTAHLVQMFTPEQVAESPKQCAWKIAHAWAMKQLGQINEEQHTGMTFEYHGIYI